MASYSRVFTWLATVTAACSAVLLGYAAYCGYVFLTDDENPFAGMFGVVGMVFGAAAVIGLGLLAAGCAVGRRSPDTDTGTALAAAAAGVTGLVALILALLLLW